MSARQLVSDPSQFFIQKPLPPAPDVQRPLPRPRVEIFRRFASVGHAPLYFFSCLRRNRSDFAYYVLISHMSPLLIICLSFRRRCFTDGADILSTVSFENALR